MWQKLRDGLYTIEMSEWSAGGFPDPVLGRTVYGFKRYLNPVKNLDNDVEYWTGQFPSGAKVMVFND